MDAHYHHHTSFIVILKYQLNQNWCNQWHQNNQYEDKLKEMKTMISQLKADNKDLEGNIRKI